MLLLCQFGIQPCPLFNHFSNSYKIHPESEHFSHLPFYQCYPCHICIHTFSSALCPPNPTKYGVSSAPMLLIPNNMHCSLAASTFVISVLLTVRGYPPCNKMRTLKKQDFFPRLLTAAVLVPRRVLRR